MAYMTEEEADALDEELTRTVPKVDFSKPDVFMYQRELLNILYYDSCAGNTPNPYSNYW